jgi:hypothetical protein
LCQGQLLSDGWRAYHRLDQIANEIYQHEVVMHEQNFVDPLHRDIHMQTVENLWMRAKRKLRRQFGISRQLFPSYQHEFLWRNRHRFLNIFSNFIISVIQQYPVCIISNSTHKLQPLDKTFMGRLKAYYSEEIRTWLRINNRAVTQFDLAELLGNALLKCQTRKLAANGFRVAGICPLNKHVFTDADFIAAEIEAEKTCIFTNCLSFS